ncbi:MAG: hypothetical protein EBX39_07420, partial [Actinobacteria bacterium]|nr:hypothetical protein [Actinomycetota bacterium]
MIVPILAEAARERAGGATDRLTLVRAAKFATAAYDAEIAAHSQFARVELIPDPDAAAGQWAHGESATTGSAGPDNQRLMAMRDWMAERCAVVVAVGGKWWDHDKDWAGIPREIDAFLHRGKPAFVVTAFGGAAGGYAAEDPSLLGRLHNGLDAEANAALNTRLAAARGEPAVAEDVANRLVTQIGLLPLARDRVVVEAGRRRGEGRDSRTTGDPRETATPRDTFRILCLDGGGIRGAFTAAVLATWAEAIKDRVRPESFIDQFDLIAGTSTGSILAVGLAMGIPPVALVDLYRMQGTKIFPKTLPGQEYVTRKYDSQPLRTALENHLRGKSLADASRPLVIPTVRARNGKAVVMTTPHAKDRVLHKPMAAVDVVMASAAAPAFFAEATVEGPITRSDYLDGGMWANNPVLPAIIEAVAHLGVAHDRIDVLSVGTLTSEEDFSGALGGGYAQWAKPITNLFFAAQESGADDLSRLLLGLTRLHRVNDFVRDLPALDDAKAVESLIGRGAEVA